MTKINRLFAEDLYEVELEISKEIRAAEENPQRWAWKVPFAPRWITREFKAYTSIGGKWSIYRLGLNLGDMTLTLDTSNTCWQPTSESFKLALDRAFNSIMKELNGHHYDALQRVLNHRFSTLVLNLYCGHAKVHNKWFGSLDKCWLGDYLLSREIEKLGLHTLRLDLRGCVLRDLLRDNGEVLSCIAQESLAFYKGHPQERRKEAEMRSGFFVIYNRYINYEKERDLTLSAADMQTCLPSWIQEIQERKGWCNSFLKALRAEILDLCLEDIKNITKCSTMDSFVEAYYNGYKKKYYMDFVDQFKCYLNDLL